MSKDESNRMETPTICEDCRHPIDRHGPEGCDIELGDTWMDGEAMGAWIAQGPCSCTAQLEAQS